MAKQRFEVDQHINAPELNAILKQNGLKIVFDHSTKFGTFQAQIYDGQFIYHTEQRFMSNDIVIVKVEDHG